MKRGPQKNVRERLQQAAFELYGERGYEQTTTAEIAARAGVTERTFFRHFADKREVAFEGEAKVLIDVAATVAAAPEGLSPMDVLLWACRSFTKKLEESRSFNEPRLAIIANTPALRERQVAKTAAMTSGLAMGLQQRGVEPTTAKLTAQIAMAVFDHAVGIWYGDSSLSLGEQLECSLKVLQTVSANSGQIGRRSRRSPASVKEESGS